MKIIAAIESPGFAYRILDSFGIVCRPPPLVSARRRIDNWSTIEADFLDSQLFVGRRLSGRSFGCAYSIDAGLFERNQRDGGREQKVRPKTNGYRTV